MKMILMYLVLLGFASFTVSASPVKAAHGSLEFFLTESKNERVYDRHFYNFGNVSQYGTRSISYKISNTGESALNFERATISGMGYSASHSCKNGLEPKKKCSVTITFAPLLEGWFVGRFILDFKENSSILIDLSANSTRL